MTEIKELIITNIFRILEDNKKQNKSEYLELICDRIDLRGVL